jgi:hypothetical protein
VVVAHFFQKSYPFDYVCNSISIHLLSQSRSVVTIIIMRRLEAFALEFYRLMAETEGEPNDDDHAAGDDDHSEFGVHITYQSLYRTVIYLTAIYVSGQVASRFLRMPDLVGEIVCGIVLGPPLADFVPNPEAWVLLGELGYANEICCWSTPTKSAVGVRQRNLLLESSLF